MRKVFNLCIMNYMALFRKFLAALVVGFLISSSVGFVSAQKEEVEVVEEEFDFNRAYQDYVFLFDVYQKQHSEFLLARAQYIQAGTLVAQTKAKEETAQMLEARDDVVISYLTALRMRLLEAEGVSDTVKGGLFDRLDVEIFWFKDHKERISSAGTLNDLIADSEEAYERFLAAEPVIYEVLSVIPIGKVSVLRAQLNVILNGLKSKTTEVRTNGDHDVEIVERWIIETEEKIIRSVDKEIAAQQRIPDFLGDGRSSSSSRRVDRVPILNDVLNLVRESNQFLREASSFMNEIIDGLVSV